MALQPSYELSRAFFADFAANWQTPDPASDPNNPAFLPLPGAENYFIDWPNGPKFDLDRQAEPWLRVDFQYVESVHLTFSGLPAPSGHEFGGIATVQIFAPSGRGTKLADLLAERVRPIINQRRIPVASGLGTADLCFRAAQPPRRVGVDDTGRWWQVNVLSRWTYLHP